MSLRYCKNHFSQYVSIIYNNALKQKTAVLLTSRLMSSSNKSNQPEITVTDKCLKRIEKILSPDELLRVYVLFGGCSGFEYKFSLEKRSDINANEDLLFENRVVIDTESLKYLLGSKIDFQDELIRSGFIIIDNPNAEKNCSCGASFWVNTDKNIDSK